MTHDYKRHGTTTLVCGPQRAEWHRDRPLPAAPSPPGVLCAFSKPSTSRPRPILDLHLIVDNYATHKTSGGRSPGCSSIRASSLHFTPTSSSWLNLIERFFAEITRKRIRRGVFRSVLDLEVAIYRYLVDHNENPKPFVWTAKPVDILNKVKRGKQALESKH